MALLGASSIEHEDWTDSFGRLQLMLCTFASLIIWIFADLNSSWLHFVSWLVLAGDDREGILITVVIWKLCDMVMSRY